MRCPWEMQAVATINGIFLIFSQLVSSAVNLAPAMLFLIAWDEYIFRVDFFREICIDEIPTAYLVRNISCQY